MAVRLAPLVQLTTGAVHPDFPRTLLAFWLLTDAQLDSLAHFYHQRTPCAWTAQYPCPVSWPPGLGIEEKRRKLGRFIGLRGCDSPVPIGVSGGGGLGLDLDLDLVLAGGGGGGGAGLQRGKEGEEAGGEDGGMLRWSEEEIVEAARRERLRRMGEEADEVGRKMGWYY